MSESCVKKAYLLGRLFEELQAILCEQVDISGVTYLLANSLKPLAESTQKDARGTNGVSMWNFHWILKR